MVVAGCQPSALRAPVSTFDAADPHLMRVGNTYYLFTTNTAEGHVPVRTSTDLVNWSPVTDALPHLPEWAAGFDVWAPSATYTDGRYVLWYAAVLGDTHCIDRAISSSPGGPYLPVGDDPFLCQNLGSTHVIDPYPFQAPDGSQYLYWADDTSPHYIVGAALDSSGLDMVGSPRRLTKPDQPWEGSQVENPAMTAVGSGFQLYYSANNWATRSYATGYLSCTTPLGPCVKTTTAKPFLAAKGSVAGPGGMSFFTTITGERWIAYHAWDGPVGYEHGGRRSLHIEPFDERESEPYVPNRTPVAALDVMSATSSGVALSGWAFDPDSPLPRTITVRDFTTGATTSVTADGWRPDVVANDPAALGASRGYATTWGLPAGAHVLCLAVGDDLTGELDWFACRTVRVG